VLPRQPESGDLAASSQENEGSDQIWVGRGKHACDALPISVAQDDRRSSTYCINPGSGILSKVAERVPFLRVSAVAYTARLQPSNSIAHRNKSAGEFLEVLSTASERWNHENQWTRTVDEYFHSAVRHVRQTRFGTRPMCGAKQGVGCNCGDYDGTQKLRHASPPRRTNIQPFYQLTTKSLRERWSLQRRFAVAHAVQRRNPGLAAARISRMSGQEPNGEAAL
jgi:hypothetical protein